MTFSEKLKKYFDVDQKRSQAAVAAEIGTSQSQVSKWKKEKLQPDLEMLPRLAEAMGLSVAYLIDDRIDDDRPETAAYSFDEKAVIQLMRALKIDGQEAMRRLSEPAREATVTLIPPKIMPGQSKKSDRA
jgi:transcriptional regulator with XRE-family HTH domain